MPSSSSVSGAEHGVDERPVRRRGAERRVGPGGRPAPPDLAAVAGVAGVVPVPERRVGATARAAARATAGSGRARRRPRPAEAIATCTWQPQVSCSATVSPNRRAISAYRRDGVIVGSTAQRRRRQRRRAPRRRRRAAAAAVARAERTLRRELVEVRHGCGAGLHLLAAAARRSGPVVVAADRPASTASPDRPRPSRARVDQQELLLDAQRPHRHAGGVSQRRGIRRTPPPPAPRCAGACPDWYAGFAHHLRERPAAGVGDQQDRVPRLTRARRRAGRSPCP